MLQTSARHWGKQTVQYAALARVTGPGLLASSEPNWIEHRRLAAPAFHHQRLEAVGDQVRAAADAAIAARLGRGRPSTTGGLVDVAALTHRIGLDAVGRALFSADLSGQAQQLLDATSEAARAGGPAGPVDPADGRVGARRRRTSGCARRGAAWTRSPPSSSRSAARAAGSHPPARTVTTSSASSWTAT